MDLSRVQEILRVFLRLPTTMEHLPNILFVAGSTVLILSTFAIIFDLRRFRRVGGPRQERP